MLCFLLPSLVTAQHTRTEHWRDRTTLFKKEAETMDTNQVVFLGNSFTEGFDLRKFFSGSQPVNRGIDGDHIDGLLERFDYSVLKLKPSKLFVMIGINDIGAGDPDSLIRSNYQELLRTILKSLPNTRVYQSKRILFGKICRCIFRHFCRQRSLSLKHSTYNIYNTDNGTW